MAIIRDDDEDALHFVNHFTCFLCHQELVFPFIHWQGAEGQLCLHPQCVYDLSMRLSRDLWELKEKDNLTFLCEGRTYS